MFPPHVALYHLFNLLPNDLLTIEHSTNKLSDLINVTVIMTIWLLFRFSSCAEFYLYTEYYELFYIETRIILLHL